MAFVPFCISFLFITENGIDSKSGNSENGTNAKSAKEKSQNFFKMEASLRNPKKRIFLPTEYPVLQNLELIPNPVNVRKWNLFQNRTVNLIWFIEFWNSFQNSILVTFDGFGINSKTAKNILGEKWNFVPKFTITVWYF